LPTSSELPKIYKNRKEVGIRVPDNNIIRTLVRELGNPILTMSLHDKDEIIEYSTDPELIEEKYENLVDSSSSTALRRYGSLDRHQLHNRRL